MRCKKHTGLIYAIVLAVLISILPEKRTIYAEECTDIDAIVGFLESIDIINANIDKPEIICNRENFALYAARCVGIDTYKTADKRYYKDVEMSGFAATAINALVEKNVLTLGENSKFRPADGITLYEACTIAVNLLDAKSFALARGGFPTGYYETADRMDIIPSGTYGTKVLTYSEAYELIFRMLQVKKNSIASLSEKGIEYEKGNETLLSENFNIYTDVGIVEAVPGGCLYSDLGVSNSTVIVNGVGYRADERQDFSDYLGCYAKIFYRDEQNMEAVYIIRTKSRAADISFNILDFEEYDDNTVSYTLSQRTKKIKLENSVVIYNGMPVESKLQERLGALNKGNMLIRDRDNDGVYDTLLVKNYENYVVGSINYDDMVLYSKTKQKIDINEWENVRIYDSNRKTIGFEDIKEMMTLSVAQSEGKCGIEIIASGKTIDVQVKGIDEEEECHIYTENANYYFDRSFYEGLKNGAYDVSPKGMVGENVTLYLDCFDNICYIKSEIRTYTQFGYIMWCGYDEENDTVLLKLLNGDNKFIKCKTADKVKLNGRNFKNKAKDFFDAICEGNIDPDTEQFVVKKQIVAYRLNDDGDIIMIDTADSPNNSAVYAKDSDDMLTSVFGGFYSQWVVENRVGFKAVLGNNTKVFYIPKGKANPQEDECFEGSYTELMSKENSYCIEVYNYGEPGGYAAAAVCLYDLLDKNKEYRTCIMVKKILKTINSDDEIVYRLTGYEDGVYVTYDIPENVNIGELDTGDLAQFYYDAKGNITKSPSDNIPDVEILYSPKDARPDWDSNGRAVYSEVNDAAVNYYRAAFQLSFGYVSRINGTLVSWGYTAGNKIDETVSIPGAVVVYDESKSGSERVYLGNINDILDHTNAGSGCSRIILKTRYGVYGAAYIYK